MIGQLGVSQELLRTFDRLPIEVAALNSRGEIVYVNAAWREFGCTNGASSDFVGENYLNICRLASLTEPSAVEVRNAIERAIAGVGGVTPLLYPCPDAHQMRWFRTYVEPVKLPDDVRVIVMHQEVKSDETHCPWLQSCSVLQTDPRQTDNVTPARLLESMSWLHAILDSVNAGLWQWEIQSGDLFWSPESYRLFGLHPDQTHLTYAIWRQAIHPDDRSEVDVAVQRAVDERTDLLDLEFRIVLPSGEVRWIKDRGKLVLDESGQPIRMIGIQIDITDQKRIAASLEYERILLRTVMDALPLALYVKDMDARKVLTNATDLEFLGESDLRRVLGKTDYELFPDSGGKTCYEEDIEVLRTGRPVIQRATEFTNQAGTRRQVLISKIPLRNRDQEIIGLVGITEDITELRRLEQKLWESRQLEALGVFASSIGHDFNNLLTPIIGLSEVLYNDTAPDSRQRQYLDKILNAAYKARDLLRQMRIFSRLHRAEVKSVNLLATVAEACDILRSSLPSSISLHVCFEVASATIEADPLQLHQMIMNLLMNAQQAIEGEAGAISVVVTPLITADSESPHGITLNVSDTGQGIDEAIIERIFEPFFTTKHGVGSGLGLAIVHGVVQNLGGTIRVESQPGQGSTFTISLPNVVVEC